MTGSLLSDGFCRMQRAHGTPAVAGAVTVAQGRDIIQRRGGNMGIRSGLTGTVFMAVWMGTCGAGGEMRAEDALVLRSPSEYQVFQRHTRTEGVVLLSGHAGLPADTLQFRVLGAPLEGSLTSDWRSIPVSAATRQFNARATVPAGGWYALEVRLQQGGETVAEGKVEKFGVGEVFVGAGQSNSTNSGEFQIQQTSGMVSSFSGEDNRWQIADDPQPGCADRSQGGSFWPAFGDRMYETYRVPIGVAATGFGGTSVNQWQPAGGLFKWFMTRVHQLGPLGFRAVLWHQGESDVQMPSEEYFDKLKTVIEESRKQAGWDVPWFVAQVSYHNPDKPRFDSTREAHARVWAEGLAGQGPDTDTLTGDNRDLGGRGIHFSPKGLKAHGALWAEQVSRELDRLLKE